MSKFAIKANALGDGDLTLEIPEMAVDQTLEFPPEGGRLARADAADGMPLMSDGTPVVESGSNSDGEWVKWGDGTQACYFSATFSGASMTATGSIYHTSNIVDRSWAQPFIDTPAGAMAGNVNRWFSTASTTTGFTGRMWNSANSTADATYRVQAIGRWK